MANNMRNNIDWGFVSVIVAVLIVAVGWGVSVEIRMSQHASFNTIQESIDTLVSRIQNIERLLIPVIVDYRVRKEVEEKMSKVSMLPPPIPSLPLAPAPVPALPEDITQGVPELRGRSSSLLNPSQSPQEKKWIKEAETTAERWVKEKIQEGQKPKE